MQYKELKQRRRDILKEYKILLETKGLEAVLNIPTDYPNLNKKARESHLHHLKILKMLGIDNIFKSNYVKENKIIEESLRLYLLGESERAEHLMFRYRIPWFQRKAWIKQFESKRIGFLNENSSIADSSFERRLDKYLHSQISNGWYIIHRHHVSYKDRCKNYNGKHKTDFEIGSFFIEVAGLINSKYFREYEENLNKKRKLAVFYNIPLIILTPNDFKDNKWLQKLKPIQDYIKEKGIESLIPKELFNFDEPLPYRFYDLQRQDHFKNQFVHWNEQ
jgi:hypothetical protein